MSIYIIVPDKYKFFSMVIIFLYWILNINYKYWFFILIIFIDLLIGTIFPLNNNLSGRVRYLNDSYFIINNVVVYTGEIDIKINYDDYVTVDSLEVTEINDSLSKYTFNFSRYYKSLNATYCCFADKIIIEKHSSSIRGKIYQYISSIKDEQISSFYKLILFNISTDEDSFIIIHGLYFSGIFYIISYFLKWFIDYKYLKYINVIISLIFGIFYHFPLALIRLTLKKILLLFNINSKDSLGILIIILLTINKFYIYSLGFVFPISFYFLNIFYKDKKILFYFNSMVIQSLFLYNFKLLNVFLFKYLMRFIGLIYLVSLLFLYSPENSLFLIKLIDGLDFINNIDYKVVGKPTVLTYLILLFVVKKTSKYKSEILTFSFIIIMILNISHPFASVTYINVDQGDSILIRLAYNRANILIDTGKPSKYIYLDSYLKAMGVKQIDYLVLTHNDSDHNGNKQKLIDNYDVKKIIEKDKDIIIGNFKMLSLNDQNYDNDNDNSLVYYFELNNLSFLMTGDISKIVERDIIEKYNGLECDILKLSHHGSKTGTDSTFIKEIKPDIAIISSGNTYHHPHQETIDILEENHVFYLQTKTKGDIEIYFTYFLNIISDYSKDFAIINNRRY
jgi:beta-lactamase superfamily II metal-dependent hydrolase